MLLCCEAILAGSSDSTTDLLSCQVWYFADCLQCFLIQDADFTIRPITQNQPLPRLLNIQFCQNKWHVLGHFITEIHLNLLSDFVLPIPHYQLRNLLVSHVCRSVNFDAECFHIIQLILLWKLKTWLNQAQITSNILENTESLNTLGLWVWIWRFSAKCLVRLEHFKTLFRIWSKCLHCLIKWTALAIFQAIHAWLRLWKPFWLIFHICKLDTLSTIRWSQVRIECFQEVLNDGLASTILVGVAQE